MALGGEDPSPIFLPHQVERLGNFSVNDLKILRYLPTSAFLLPSNKCDVQLLENPDKYNEYGISRQHFRTDLEMALWS